MLGLYHFSSLGYYANQYPLLIACLVLQLSIMFDHIKAKSQIHKAKQEYWENMKAVLADDKFGDAEALKLDTISHSLSLSDDQLKDVYIQGANLLWSTIIQDHVITEEEKESLQSFMKKYGLKNTDFNFNQDEFNICYSMGIIQKGHLPNLNPDTIDLIYKPEEILHWVCPASLMKYKRVVQRVNFAGPRVSIKIMKGLTYRAGSYKISAQSNEYLVPEDSGSFWLTNQRFGFMGTRKNFVLTYNKVLHFELTSDGLSIAKEGRDNPYLLHLDSYEVPAAILSHIINA